MSKSFAFNTEGMSVMEIAISEGLMDDCEACGGSGKILARSIERGEYKTACGNCRGLGVVEAS